MNKKHILISMLFFSFLIFLIPITETKADIHFIRSTKTSIIPTIDGNFLETEWEDARHYSFYHTNPSEGHPPGFVHLYVKHTSDTLFLLIDDIPDNTSDTGDVIYIDFDCNYDGVTDSNISMDLNRAETFTDAGNALANWSFGFQSTINNATVHTVIEIAINITMTSEYDGYSKPEDMSYILPVGSNIRMMIKADEQFVCNWSIPQNGNLSDPLTYAEISFKSESPLLLYLLLLAPQEVEAIPFTNLKHLLLLLVISVGIVAIITKKHLKTL